ncbi:hypothetical protein LCGC14_1764300 [marine sediment metagenome]|uniref:Uncharacterized protein n=1 Tax=marine sediment metagenome TaxID=412755 RepID=A0A0F9JF33_9ZZZZ
MIKLPLKKIIVGSLAVDVVALMLGVGLMSMPLLPFVLALVVGNVVGYFLTIAIIRRMGHNVSCSY